MLAQPQPSHTCAQAPAAGGVGSGHWKGLGRRQAGQGLRCQNTGNRMAENLSQEVEGVEGMAYVALSPQHVVCCLMDFTSKTLNYSEFQDGNHSTLNLKEGVLLSMGPHADALVT